MDVLWRASQPLAVRRVLEAVNEGPRPALAYTTVMTVLGRLFDKGVVRRERAGRGYVYSAALTNEAAISVHGVVQEHGDAALAAFVDEAKANPKIYRRLRRLMEEGEI